MNEIKNFNVIIDNPQDSQDTIKKAVLLFKSMDKAEQIYALKFLRMLKEAWD